MVKVLFWNIKIRYNVFKATTVKMLMKYEQSMNMSKILRNHKFVRIFRQILAKKELQRQCLQGVPEAAVEMKKARLGH